MYKYNLDINGMTFREIKKYALENENLWSHALIFTSK
jgi:hypothetical protein